MSGEPDCLLSTKGLKNVKAGVLRDHGNFASAKRRRGRDELFIRQGNDGIPNAHTDSFANPDADPDSLLSGRP